ncbi:MAG: cell division ATP-binding protein FtsE [Candidatus Dojkabacteria bacterium]
MVLFDTVTKKYKDDITALEDVNFLIEEGEFCFLTGPSGAGKSTIMKLLIREELPTSGSIFFRDIEVPKLTRNLLPAYRQKLGVVFQDIKLLQRKTLEENIAFALEILDKSPKEIADTTDYLLDLVGLRDRRTLFPEELSGGEQQRGAIARALANKPDLFIADEPTGNLDTQNALQILDILRTINNTGTTVMVISHDYDLLNNSKSRVIKIKDGKLEEDTGKKPIPKKKESKVELSKELEGLSKSLQEKLKQFAISSPEILLNITTSDLENMKLTKEEHSELETFVKNYLSKK